MVLKYRFFFIFNLLVAGLCFSSCNPRDLPIIKGKLKESRDQITKQTEENIKINPELRDLDNLCKQIPLPGSFKFISKSQALNGPDTLSYNYYSEDDFNKTDKHFKEYFNGNGWEIYDDRSFNSTSSFRKENIRFIIQYGGMTSSDINYGIACGKIQ